MILQVVVTEVLDGGRFYVQNVADQKVASIQRQLASLNLQEAPVIGAFNPKKGDIVLARFSADNSWNRAMVSEPIFLSSLNTGCYNQPPLPEMCGFINCMLNELSGFYPFEL